MRHCIPRAEWHFWHFGVQIAASQNRPEVLIAESVAVLELGVNRTTVKRAVSATVRVRGAAIRLARYREPHKRTSHGISNVEDSTVAAQVAVTRPSCVALQLL